MKNLKIGNRLDLLSTLSSSYKTIADIGTDHGYLPYDLFEKNKIDRAILCDINKGPLENAKNTFQGTHYEESVDFRLGSGIEPLENHEVELAVIAGMGGGLIIDILSKNLSKTSSISAYLLQPMTEQASLREWLIKEDMLPIMDYFTSEGNKYYQVIHVGMKELAPSFSVYQQFNDLEFGHTISVETLSDYMRFLDFKARKYRLILENAYTHQNKRQWCETKLATIAKIIHALKGDYHDYIR